MSNFESLTRMGIQNPEDITRYELYSVNQMDVLRVIYDRKKGSILPVTKKYLFPQIKKSTMVDSGTRQTQVLFESSAELRNAVAALDELIVKREAVSVRKDDLLNDIQLLEEDFAARINHIKLLIKQMQ